MLLRVLPCSCVFCRVPARYMMCLLVKGKVKVKDGAFKASGGQNTDRARRGPRPRKRPCPGGHRGRRKPTRTGEQQALATPMHYFTHSRADRHGVPCGGAPC
eukprot:5803263-Pyramimonas_sp.AAC.1